MGDRRSRCLRLARLARLALGLLALCGLFDGCGGARSPVPALPRAPGPELADAGASDAAARAAVPSFEALVERATPYVLGMSEAGRSDDLAARPLVVAASASDVCARAVFGSSDLTRAWFEDDAHIPRGEASSTASAGLVPPKGPACARKGESLRLVVQSDGRAAVQARAIVWRSP